MCFNYLLKSANILNESSQSLLSIVDVTFFSYQKKSHSIDTVGF